MFYEALKFASIKHHGQLRKSRTGTEIPYVVHCIDVAGRLDAAGASDLIIVVGLLHDTLEDTKTTQEELSARFGATVAYGVSELTLPPEVDKDFNLKREFQVKKMRTMDLDWVRVKIADKTSNLRSLISEPPPWGQKAIRGVIADSELVVRTGYERFKQPDAVLSKLYLEFTCVYSDVLKKYPASS